MTVRFAEKTVKEEYMMVLILNYTWDLHCFGILSGSLSPDRT